jgi:hypothetical protein
MFTPWFLQENRSVKCDWYEIALEARGRRVEAKKLVINLLPRVAKQQSPNLKRSTSQTLNWESYASRHYLVGRK